MRRNVWIISDGIVSALGRSSQENFDRICRGKTGIRLHPHQQAGLYAALTDMGGGVSEHQTKFETFVIDAARQALTQQPVDLQRTIFILSTTKGNVSLLSANSGHPRLALHESARHVATTLGMPAWHVVSNACISGVLALMVAQRLLLEGKYEHALVVGADEISPFIISGFQSLHALSDGPCKPYDIDRSGLSLGEGAGAILLSIFPPKENDIAVRISGGGLTNDANHISGPSRTGQELANAIGLALAQAGVTPADIDAVSAHGTATRYNDDMEAKAFTLAGLSYKPLNSLKGNIGHTLGAAGTIETIIARHGMMQDLMPGTTGFQKAGICCPLHINKETRALPQTHVLKTASGFGGCNAAIVLTRQKTITKQP